MSSRLDQKEFIKRSEAVHPGRYDYSVTEYRSARYPISIICPEHGTFSQIPSNHMKGVGCPACANVSRATKASLDTARFILKATKVHRGKYNYEKVDYTGFGALVSITCPFHGVFEQRANNHLAGNGCSKCGYEKQQTYKKDTKESFIVKANAVHSKKYKYDRVEYTGSRNRIEIGCYKHGYFFQNPVDHLQGKGCFLCGVEKRNLALTNTQADFLNKAMETHGKKYNYSGSRYTGFHAPLKIECYVHGVFTQTPAHHISGQGCPECGFQQLSLIQRDKPEDFIKRCVVVHADKYDYSKTDYLGSKVKIEVGCPKHGYFFQAADDHVSGHGCPSCVHQYSEPHKEIERYIDELQVHHKSNDRTQIAPYELDIWIPSHSLAIEFNGRYYHSLDGSEPPQAKHRHRDKYRMCNNKGILLLQIDEHEWSNPVTREVWKSVIASKLGKHTRIPARKTVFKSISSPEANDFFAVNHLQGATPALRWSFGLFYKEELVGVVAYCWHQKTLINLSRLAFKLGTTVVGGSQKLFTNSIPLLPVGDVVSFSNNQYSNGSIYSTLGFNKERDLPPSYQWLFKGRVVNKRGLRRKALLRILGDNFDPSETEHQNLYRVGARCLYDAGYQKWVFTRLSTSIDEVFNDKPPSPKEAC